jgi:hypothetical protein
LKNQLIQAFAAIDFAKGMSLKLRFHMNSGRIEGGGNPCDRNLHSLFEHLDPEKYQIIFHKWLTHENFIDLIKTMDIGMQLSFSETFNIVGADHVINGIPFLGNSEIPWWDQDVDVSTTDRWEIVKSLHEVYSASELVGVRNQINLIKYVETSQKLWLDFLKGQ